MCHHSRGAPAATQYFNTARLYNRQLKRTVFYSATSHWAEESYANGHLYDVILIFGDVNMTFLQFAKL